MDSNTQNPQTPTQPATTPAAQPATPPAETPAPATPSTPEPSTPTPPASETPASTTAPAAPAAGGTPPPAATPPAQPATTPPAQAHHGKNPMFIALPVILLVALVGGGAAYFMTMQQKAPAKNVETLQAPSTILPTPTPTTSIESLEQEAAAVSPGSEDSDLIEITTDLDQL